MTRGRGVAHGQGARVVLAARSLRKPGFELADALAGLLGKGGILACCLPKKHFVLLEGLAHETLGFKSERESAAAGGMPGVDLQARLELGGRVIEPARRMRGVPVSEALLSKIFGISSL